MASSSVAAPTPIEGNQIAAHDRSPAALRPTAPRSKKALEATDAHGHLALVWRSDNSWIIDAKDPAFRRRIDRALRKPLTVWDYVPDSGGDEACGVVQIRPNDPRYANLVFRHWHQLGLHDVTVRLVPLDDSGTHRHQNGHTGT